tara:strand:+ start:263 stop:658 length:396 start_codon:yes stop_codon:yes gene_type:complete
MATSYDLNITRGSDFSVRLSVKDSNGAAYNLSGYSTSGVAKYRYSDSNPIVSLSPVIVSGSGGSTLASGLIDINISGTATTGIPIVQGVYDVEIYKGTYHEKVIQGKINILPEVTSPLTTGHDYTASGKYY